MKMNDGGGEIIMPIPYEVHEPIYAELQELAASLGMKEEVEDARDCVGLHIQLATLVQST
jgi:hypothetical protein